MINMNLINLSTIIQDLLLLLFIKIIIIAKFSSVKEISLRKDIFERKIFI